MDYEKKYKESLEKARQKTTNINRKDRVYYVEDIEELFPELRESEDERIRKKLISLFQSDITEQFGEFTNEQFIAWLEKQGEQKPTEKVEPKFKIGDTIVNKNGDKCTITNRCLLYQYYSDSNHSHEIKFSEQDKWKLVEQKPEQNPAWSEEDEKKVNKLVSLCTNLQNSNTQLYSVSLEFQELIDWLKSLKPQPRQEWSEDDEKMLKDTISCLSAYKEPDISKGLCYQEQIDWLKSLKPQPRQEWSKEDERMLTSIIDDTVQEAILDNSQINWLKSLKSQQNYDKGYNDGYSAAKYNNWKPSNEQMEALKKAMHCGANNYDTKEKLESLYNDLKNS